MFSSATVDRLYFSHCLGEHDTHNTNKDEIDDHETIDRNTVFVELIRVFLETFSTDEVDVFSILRSTTTEIKPGFTVLHFGKNAKEDCTDYKPN